MTLDAVVGGAGYALAVIAVVVLSATATGIGSLVLIALLCAVGAALAARCWHRA